MKDPKGAAEIKDFVDTFEDNEIVTILKEVEVNTPRADFPVFIFMIAIVKDFLDLSSLGFLGIIATALFAMVFFIWIYTKSNFMQRIILKYLFGAKGGIRVFWFFLVGSIPIIGAIFPESILLVLMVHNKEKKVVRIIMELARREMFGFGRV